MDETRIVSFQTKKGPVSFEASSRKRDVSMGGASPFRTPSRWSGQSAVSGAKSGALWGRIRANRKPILIGVGLIAALIVVIIGVSYGIKLRAGTGITPEPTTPNNLFAVTVKDAVTGEPIANEKWSVLLYDCDITEMDDAQIRDLGYSDYSLVEILTGTETYAIKANRVYMMRFNSTEYANKTFVPSAGMNTIYAVKLADGLGTTLHEANGNSQSLPIANEAYRDWVLGLYWQDDKGRTSSLVGFQSSLVWEFGNEKYSGLIVIFEFNITASNSFVDISSDSYEISEESTGNQTAVGLQGTFLGQIDLPIRFSSGLGVSYSVASVTIANGIIGEPSTYIPVAVFA